MKHLLVFLLLWISPALPVLAEINTTTAPQKLSVKMVFGQKSFSYFANFETEKINSNITQAIIVVHGSALNAETYFNTIQSLTKKNSKESEILIIAPHYRTTTEKPYPASPLLVWTDEGWLKGDPAVNAKVSSFEVIDQFVRLAMNKKIFPNIKNIVITGHSAGGQLTQKYALGSPIEKESHDIHYRYIVLNPGSYTYLTEKRLNKAGEFTVPINPGCAYDEYKYGLKNKNLYMNQIPHSNMIQSYLNKEIMYLIGSQDTMTIDFDLTCPALLQGPHRYARALNFKAFLDFEFPLHKHTLITVPDVGHTQHGMYNSIYGIRALFDGF